MYGYPEVYDNNHLDGVQLCRFLQAGIKEVVLRPNQPCSAFVFHQLHDVGRAGRKERNIGPDHNCANEVDIESRLSKFVNETGWGHPFDVFEEDSLIVEEKGRPMLQGEDSVEPKNVISFSLYGSGNRYWGGAVPNAKLASEIYPGWKVRFYHDSLVPQGTLNELATLPNVDLYDMSGSSITNPRTWRFLVALDPEVTGAYIVRDIDSRLNHREQSAVEEWMQSSFTFHNMHDHNPGHCGMPIQAGMWGGKSVISSMKCVIERCNATKIPVSFWDDANGLQEFVWPILKLDVLHHDSFCCGKFNETSDSRPFPTSRQEGTGEHVGSVYLPVLEGKLRDRDRNTVLAAVERKGCKNGVRSK